MILMSYPRNIFTYFFYIYSKIAVADWRAVVFQQKGQVFKSEVFAYTQRTRVSLQMHITLSHCLHGNSHL